MGEQTFESSKRRCYMIKVKARLLPVLALASVGCGPGLRDDPKVPVFFPGTDHEIRCDEAFRSVSEVMDLPRCSTSTKSCVDACGFEPQCVHSCLVKDQTPAAAYKPVPEWNATCADCYYDAVEHCGTKVCRALQGEFYCCAAQHECTYDELCTPCEAEGYAYDGCMNTPEALDCMDHDETPKCFPPSSS